MTIGRTPTRNRQQPAPCGHHWTFCITRRSCNRHRNKHRSDHRQKRHPLPFRRLHPTKVHVTTEEGATGLREVAVDTLHGHKAKPSTHSFSDLPLNPEQSSCPGPQRAQGHSCFGRPESEAKDCGPSALMLFPKTRAPCHTSLSCGVALHSAVFLGVDCGLFYPAGLRINLTAKVSQYGQAGVHRFGLMVPLKSDRVSRQPSRVPAVITTVLPSQPLWHIIKKKDSWCHTHPRQVGSNNKNMLIDLFGMNSVGEARERDLFGRVGLKQLLALVKVHIDDVGTHHAQAVREQHACHLP